MKVEQSLYLCLSSGFRLRSTVVGRAATRFRRCLGTRQRIIVRIRASRVDVLVAARRGAAVVRIRIVQRFGSALSVDRIRWWLRASLGHTSSAEDRANDVPASNQI